MPRQIPSTGMSRSIARSAIAISKSSRSRWKAWVSAMRLLAVERGVEVGAAGEHQPIDPIEQLVGVLGEGRVGRDQQRSRRPR